MKKGGTLNKISFWTVTSVVVANMVGTGVFTSLGFQVIDLQSGFVLMMLWLVGGVLALCGALGYGMLATAMPRSGGEYHFLSRIYSPAVGFVAGVVSMTVGFAAPLALAAMAFGKYFETLWPGANASLLASLLTVGVALIHLHSVKAGGRFQNVATLLKLGLILCLVGAGVMASTHSSVSFVPKLADFPQMGGAPFAISLIYVMYAYSGWNAATYIMNEIHAPKRTVPLALVAGTLVVTVLYLALNAIFLKTTPLDALKGKLEVGSIVATHIFGANGGRVFSGLICLALVSTISAMTWAGPRVAQVMGEDFRALHWLSFTNGRGVPVTASGLQLALVNGLIWWGTFQSVLVYTQFTLNLCTLLAIGGVFVLHRRGVVVKGTWGYPVAPAVFMGITLVAMGYLLWTQWRESLAGLATMLVALIFYWLMPRGVRVDTGKSTEIEVL
ncbi:MAG: amino acid permease [Chthoniobacteraceae bacterium]